VEKQLKGWRREKKLNPMGTIHPEFNKTAAKSKNPCAWSESI
jgi:hypothetical protein